MALTEEQKKANKHDQMLQTAKAKQIGKVRGEVARALQHAIRAEAGAFVGNVKAVVNGQIEGVASPLGEVVCVTCGTVLPWSQKGTDAGHFLPGRTHAILLEEVGIHPQCSHCNCHESGAGEAYTTYMLAVYGQDVIDELRQRKNGFVRDVDGRDHKIEPLTRDQLITKKIGYLERSKRAEETIKRGLTPMPEIAKKQDAFIEQMEFDFSQYSETTAEKLIGVGQQARKVGRAISMGIASDLLEVRHLVAHGEWKNYVTNVCWQDYREITKWMKVVEEFKSVDSTLLDRIANEALKELAANAAPLEAKEEVLFLASSGAVSYTTSKEIIKKHKEAKKPAELQLESTKAKSNGKPKSKEKQQEENDASVADAIGKMEVGTTDVPDPAEPVGNYDNDDEPLTFEEDVTALWEDASFDERIWMIEFVMTQPEYKHQVTPKAAVEKRGQVKKKRTTPQNGKPKKKAAYKYNPATEELPFNSEAFSDAWSNWIRHRIEIKAVLTETSVKMQIGKLKKLGEARAIACIEHTIEMGWKGLREGDVKDNKQTDVDDLAIV